MTMPQRKLLPYAFVAPAMLAMLVLVFYPLVNGILFSFTNANQTNTFRRIGANVIPASYSFVGLKNYVDIFSQTTGEFWPVLAQTVVWTAVNVVLHVSIGCCWRFCSTARSGAGRCTACCSSCPGPCRP